MPKRLVHNHGIDPSCNEHPIGDCIINRLTQKAKSAEGKLEEIQKLLDTESVEEYTYGTEVIPTDYIRNVLRTI